jgi:hypothetical protein
MLHEKFGLESAATKTDNGLQKYLDGYEISPHPDIRQKALTYMININPSASSEKLYFHTHYLRFTSEWKYIEEYWRGHPEHDRCWVPWDWCESVKIQTRNNSIVMFSPSDSTLHAIRTSYDHLSTQRTQFYGNLWYRTSNTTGKPNWRDFQVNPTPERLAQRTLKSYIHGLLPTPAVKAIKRFVAKQ